MNSDAIKNIAALPQPTTAAKNNQVLNEQKPTSAVAGAEELTFSKHLSDRINRRKLDFSGEKIARLNDAVTKAAGKGSRDSVVLLDDLAVLVNVTKRTVLTAIDTGNMKDGVFTNIDSVVVG